MAVLAEISRFIIPILLIIIPLYAAVKKVHVYEVFVKGASDGLTTAVRILPFLLGMMVAIAVFKASGAFDYFCLLVKPVTDFLGIPPDILPLGIMRPFSGGASLGLAAELINTYGPDSFLGRLASVMQGTTDTTFYVLAVYFGSVSVTKYRYAIAVGLTADITTFIASIIICNILFA